MCSSHLHFLGLVSILIFMSFIRESASIKNIGIAPSPSPANPPKAIDDCSTGNPIDDCLRCNHAPWYSHRKRLVYCSVGHGKNSIGGMNGPYYIVTDHSDNGLSGDPKPGTLRHAVTLNEPVWIIFERDMEIKLKANLFVKGYKTIDGRGADVRVTGHGCIVIRNVEHVIVHGIYVHGCMADGKNTGDGISVFGSRDVWIDHCTLSNCTDGLIDVTHNSTAVTISNNLLTHHNKVMLLGHSDKDDLENILRVTVAYNHFGEGLIQRMPRCRHGYFHVVNNYYSGWGIYAVGGSANPTILSQGNVYVAPKQSHLKEVTARIGATDEGAKWNWTSAGDMFIDGAFFVSSGSHTFLHDTIKEWNVQAKPATMVANIVRAAGVPKSGYW